MRGSLVFRLTLLYGGLFLLFAVGIYFWATQTFSRFYLQSLDDHLRLEVMEMQKEYLDDGMKELEEAFREEAEAQGKTKVFYRLLTPGGETLASSDLTAWPNLFVPRSELEGLRPGEEKWSSLTLPGRKTPVRVFMLKTAGGHILQAGIDMGEGGRMLIWFERVLLASLVAILILGSVAGGWMVHRAMRGVRRVTETALEIREHNLGTRVPLENEGTEIDRLAAGFNSMLDRIASLVRNLREVSDNVAHDLKRPVTRIRSIAEMELTRPDSSEETREAAGLIIEECDRLVGTVNTMLEIARLDAVGAIDPRQMVDLTALCRNAAELFGPVAEDRGMRIVLDVPEEPVFLPGEPTQLQRALANLLDNAIRYAEGGTITISVRSSQEACRVTVADTGPGIPKAMQGQIFERFFRGDSSRTETGSGLGLSLVQSIVKAHRGRVELESAPGQGSRFTLVFPKSPPPSDSNPPSRL